MSRPPSAAARTTIYRLRGVDDLSGAIRAKYVEHEGFDQTQVQVGGRDGLLIVGAMTREHASWADRLAALGGTAVDVGNTTAAAALLIRVGSGEVWALTYGMGFQLLTPERIDPGFGIRFAVRSAAPEALQSLTRTVLDHRSRTDRSTIPGGEALRGFGIGDFGEIVTRLVGKATVPGLTAGDVSVAIRGADALSVPLGKTPSSLLSDLDLLASVAARPPQPELEALEQITRVKGELVTSLDDELRAALVSSAADSKLGIGWPHERIDENGTPSSYRLIGLGHRQPEAVDGVPILESVVEALQEKSPADPLGAASTIKLQLFRDADGEEAISSLIPAANWLMFETEHNDRRYCYFDGRWFELDADYSRRLATQVREIFERPATVAMPEWNLASHVDEAAYNVFAAGELGAVKLDRQLVRTEQHPRGFEACDIVCSDGTLIHVKHIPASSEASHLIAQAAVSTEALRFDNDARARLRTMISDHGGTADWLPDRPRSIVLAMARDRPLTADNLFSFTQVTLARLDRSLAEAGIALTVAAVLRVSG